MKKLRELINKHWDMIAYMIFGVFTTAINYAVYLPCYNILGLSAAVSNAVAWVVAVAAAFFTNKQFVFKSPDWSLKVVLPELTKFIACRAGSGLLETAILLVCVDWLGWDGNIVKAFTGIIAIVINYVGSKLLVFKR